MRKDVKGGGAYTPFHKKISLQLHKKKGLHMVNVQSTGHTVAVLCCP